MKKKQEQIDTRKQEESKHDDDDDDSNSINSIFIHLRANLTLQRPTTKLTRLIIIIQFNSIICYY
jgi:hypothetical protein